MRNCINIKSKEFQDLKDQSGLSSFKLEYLVYKYQNENNTDLYPSLDYLTLNNDARYVELSKNIQNKNNELFNLLEVLNLNGLDRRDYTVLETTNINYVKELANKLGLNFKLIENKSETSVIKVQNNTIYFNSHNLDSKLNLQDFSEIVSEQLIPIVLKESSNRNSINHELYKTLKGSLVKNNPNLIDDSTILKTFSLRGPIIISSKNTKEVEILHSDDLTESFVLRHKNTLYYFSSEKEYSDIVANYGNIENAIKDKSLNLNIVDKSTEVGLELYNNFKDELKPISYNTLLKNINRNQVINNILQDELLNVINETLTTSQIDNNTIELLKDFINNHQQLDYKSLPSKKPNESNLINKLNTDEKLKAINQYLSNMKFDNIVEMDNPIMGNYIDYFKSNLNNAITNNKNIILNEEAFSVINYSNIPSLAFEKMQRQLNKIEVLKQEIKDQIEAKRKQLEELEKGNKKLEVKSENNKPISENNNEINNNYTSINDSQQQESEINNFEEKKVETENSINNKETENSDDENEVTKALNLDLKEYNKLTDEKDEKLDNYLKTLMESLGVSIEEYESLKDRFKVDANGAANLLTKVIFLSKNRNIGTMAEESLHILVEMMTEKNSDIKYMLANIEKWAGYQLVYDKYMPVYKSEDKVKKEALGKMLTEMLIDEYNLAKNKNKKSKYKLESENTIQTKENNKSFWNRVKKALTNFLNFINDKFNLSINTKDEKLARKFVQSILNGEIQFSKDLDINYNTKTNTTDLVSDIFGENNTLYDYDINDFLPKDFDDDSSLPDLAEHFTNANNNVNISGAIPSFVGLNTENNLFGSANNTSKNANLNLDSQLNAIISASNNESTKKTSKEASKVNSAKKAVAKKIKPEANKLKNVKESKEYKQLEQEILDLQKQYDKLLDEENNTKSIMDDNQIEIINDPKIESLLRIKEHIIDSTKRLYRTDDDISLDKYFSELSNTKYVRTAEHEEQLQNKIKLIESKLNVKILLDEEMEHRGALLASNHPLTKKFNIPVIIINPNKVLSDTVFHEIGHLYIELLGGIKDSRIKTAIDYLKGTEIYFTISDKYPELKGEELDKEVLSTALGMEADKLFNSGPVISIEKLTWWQKFIAYVKSVIGSIFKSSNKTENALLSLAKDVSSLNQNLRNTINTRVYENKITQYSKSFEIKSASKNAIERENENIDIQSEVLNLFADIKSKLKTDFENGKHDYYLEGEILTNGSISGVSKNIAKSDTNNRNSPNKGDIDEKLDITTIDESNIMSILNRPTIPLALAVALDDFAKGNIEGLDDNFKKPADSEISNWYQLYLYDIQNIDNKTLLEELSNQENIFGGNNNLLVEKSFRNEIIENLEVILNHAQKIQNLYNRAPIVGNIIHKNIEALGLRKQSSFDDSIKNAEKLIDIINDIINIGEANGSKFVFEQPLYDEINKRAGTADMIEITKDGKYRIYDFKTIKSFKDKKGVDIPDYYLYVTKGYMHQLIAYGNILTKYGIEPAKNAYNILMIQTDYKNFKEEGDDIKIGEVRLKSMEDSNLKSNFVKASKSVNKYFKPKLDLSKIHTEKQMETADDAVEHIKSVLTLYKNKLKQKTKNVNTKDLDKILSKLAETKDNDNTEAIAKTNEYIAKRNKSIIESFVNNIFSNLENLENQKNDSDITKFVHSLNYVLQIAEELYTIEKIITDENQLNELGFTAKEKIEFSNKIYATINLIKENREYYKNQLKELAIYKLSELGVLGEGIIKENLRKEARAKGLKTKAEINNYVFKNLPLRTSEIRQTEIKYWNNQYENGMLDLRTLEAWFSDPGMIKSNVIKALKTLMDTNDMVVRKEIMNYTTDTVKWYDSIKSNNPSGGTKTQWGRFLLKSNLYSPSSGKVELLETGRLISEYISEYALDVMAKEDAIDSLMYEKKHILSKKITKESSQRLEEIENEKHEILQAFYKKSSLKKKQKDVNYRKQVVNPEFQKLSETDKNILRTIHKGLLDSDELLNDNSQKLNMKIHDDVILYRLPYQRMSNIEAHGNGNLKSNFISKIKDIKRPPSDDTEYNLSDEEITNMKHNTPKEQIGTGVSDLKGNPLFDIPLWYRNKLEDPKEQSFDIPSLMVENREASLIYKNNSELEADAFIIAESVNTANNNKILKVNEITGNSIYDKIGKVQYISENNLLYKAVNSSIHNRLHKRAFMGVIDKKNYKLMQVTQGLMKHASINSLALNFKSFAATLGQGTIFRFIEANVGEHFNRQDWLKGTAKAYGDIANIIADSQKQFPESKTELLLRHFGMEQNAKVLTNKFVQDNFATKNMDSGTLYLVTSMAEKMVTATLVYSLLNNIKALNSKQEYIDKDGKVVKEEKDAMSLDEAFEVKDGKLVLNPHLVYTTKDLINKYSDNNSVAETKISNSLQSIYADMYGQYNEHLRSMAQRTLAGKLVMSMKGWLPRGLHRRFRGVTTAIPFFNFMDYDELNKVENIEKRFFSYDQQMFQEGYYTSFVRYIGSVLNQLIENKKIISNSIITGTYNSLSEHEQANIKRAMIEAALMTILGALSMFLAGVAKSLADDDEDKEKIYFLTYMCHRINSELTTFVSYNSMIDMIKNPAAAEGTVSSIYSLLKRLVDYKYDVNTGVDWAINDRFAKGKKRDELKIKYEALGLINPIKSIGQFKSILGFDSKNTMEDAYKGTILRENL